jgi:hypothetical protein
MTHRALLLASALLAHGTALAQTPAASVSDAAARAGSSSGGSTATPNAAIVTESMTVTNFPANQPVSGTVSVSNLPATQPVSAAALPTKFLCA